MKCIVGRVYLLMPPRQKTVRAGGVSKGKQKIVKNVTYNITNNINNYFQPQPGPAPAPEAVPEKPSNLFPADEVAVDVSIWVGGSISCDSASSVPYTSAIGCIE